MKILDRYIIINLIKYFLFITISMQLICIIIDLSQRINRIEKNNGSIINAIMYYYPLWSIWLINTFSPISLFISTMLFTSRMNKNLELMSILINGISFIRILFPYFFFSFFIGLISLLMNFYIIPKINKKKNRFYYEYLISSKQKKEIKQEKKIINVRLSKNEYMFIQNFSKKKNIGINCLYQKYDNKKLIGLITSKYVFWSEKNKIFILYDYRYIKINRNRQYMVDSGKYRILKSIMSPKSNIFSEKNLYEKMNINELIYYIKKNNRINNDKKTWIYFIEFYQRISTLFSSVIFTMLGVGISFKKDNDFGKSIFIGISLIFLYLFFTEFIKTYFINNSFISIFIFIPNFIIGLITIFYLKSRRI